MPSRTEDIEKLDPETYANYYKGLDGYGVKFELNKRSNQLEILLFDEDREIWEKQECETEQAYQRFLTYCTERRKNGKQFRLVDVAEKLGASETSIRNQSTNLKWRQRREAYQEFEKEAFKERVRYNIYEKVDQRFKQMQMMDDLIESTLTDGINTKKMTELSKVSAVEKITNTMLKMQDSFVQLLKQDLVATKDGFTTKDGKIQITFTSKEPDNE